MKQLTVKPDGLPPLDHDLIVARYPVSSERLKPWIKFIWHLETQSRVTVNHRLLPTDSIDVLLNLSDEIHYQIEGQEYCAGQIHFNGMRDRHSFITQEGILQVIGISFHSFGLYPFLGLPLNRMNDQIVDLDSAAKTFAYRLRAAAQTPFSPTTTVQALEQALEASLNICSNDLKNRAILASLTSFFRLSLADGCTDGTINSFCFAHGLNVKTLERMCLKYTGLTPKKLQRMMRFQWECSPLIRRQERSQNRSGSCGDSYFDQSHYIREFQAFTGTTPRNFEKIQDTVQANMDLVFR